MFEGKKDDNRCCCWKTKIFLQHDQGIDGSRLNYERVYYCDDYDHNFPHHPPFVIIGGAVIWVIRSNDSSQRGDSGDRKQPEVAAQTKMMRATIKNSKVRITAVQKNPKSLRTSRIRLRKAKGERRRRRFLLMRRRNLIIQQILIRCSSSSTPAQTKDNHQKILQSFELNLYLPGVETALSTLAHLHKRGGDLRIWPWVWANFFWKKQMFVKFLNYVFLSALTSKLRRNYFLRK